MSIRPFRFSIQDAMDLAVKKAGLEGFQAYMWRSLSNGPNDYDSLVTGCVPDGLYTRGKNKGRPRFRNPKPGTVRELAVTTSELIAWAKAYVRDTGRCWDCKGEGRTIAGSHIEHGPTYRTCARCAGSGVDPTYNTSADAQEVAA